VDADAWALPQMTPDRKDRRAMAAAAAAHGGGATAAGPAEPAPLMLAELRPESAGDGRWWREVPGRGFGRAESRCTALRPLRAGFATIRS
jgi:hypothetical protein